MNQILKYCISNIGNNRDVSGGQLRSSEEEILSNDQNNSKGFWKVDKDLEPNQRMTEMTKLSYMRLKEIGINSFIDENTTFINTLNMNDSISYNIEQLDLISTEYNEFISKIKNLSKFESISDTKNKNKLFKYVEK